MTAAGRAPHPDLSPVRDACGPGQPGGVDLFTVCRNEGHLLPAFLDHYRALGVDRVFVIDNGSTDDTAAVLAGRDNLAHFHTDARYFDANDGCDWVRAVMAARAPDRWGVFADADELLVYPGAEDIPLPALVQALEAEGATGLFAFMLDFYSPRLFDTAPYTPGTPFTQAHPHFDGAGYVAGFPALGRARADESPDLFIRGGVRHRLIDWSAAGKRPVLRKVPLARALGGVPPWTGSHAVTRRRLSAMTGALLHFRFLGKSDTSLRADVEGDRRGRHQPVTETYLRLWQDGAPDPMDAALTQTWRDSLHLVELGLCALPKPCVAHLKAALRARHIKRDWQPVVQRLKAASRGAAARFAPAPGAVFQLVDSY